MAELRPEPGKDTPPPASSSAPSTPSTSSSPSASNQKASAPTLPLPPPRRPVSEALLNDKWDRAVSSFMVRSALGASAGVVLSVLLFRRRAFPVWVGLGFGAGRAWEEADASFRKGPNASGEGVRLARS